MGNGSKIVKKIFWKLPIPLRAKVKIRSWFPQNKDLTSNIKNHSFEINEEIDSASYIENILKLPDSRSSLFKEYCQHSKIDNEYTICAFYLTQYHPTEKNNLWWGKGTTEWTNVSKAVPQFVGHYQPRLPGELGFYDLRIIDNMREQIRIAKNYGINSFCFYYYWFNGERALELPLDNFIRNSDLDIKFCLCWCNEDWTKRYSGSSSEVLLSIGKDEDSYQKFIVDIAKYFLDNRYLKINDKLVLIIYRPSEIPNCKKVLSMWRSYIRKSLQKELYLIASNEAMIDTDWTKYGFDAMSQFHPGSCIKNAIEITKNVKTVRKDFCGHIYDYSEMVNRKLFLPKPSTKTYPSIMPMWDNTSRRNNAGTIFINSTPAKFKEMANDAFMFLKDNHYLDTKLLFINAWNEWSEGAYMEPDREFGYSYLESLYEAIQETKDLK